MPQDINEEKSRTRPSGHSACLSGVGSALVGKDQHEPRSQRGGIDRAAASHVVPRLEALLVYELTGKQRLDEMLKVFDYGRVRYGCNLFVIDSLKRELIQGFSHFEVVEDLGNALKHFERTQSVKRQGLTANDFTVGDGAAFSDGTYYSDGTSHADAPGVVRVEFKGEIIDLTILCESCLAYLQALQAKTEPG